jgi:hypothetical protein
MENCDILDSMNEVHLWALHFVFLQRINQCLSEFISQWNNHNLSTVQGRTPMQLRHSGMIQNVGRHDCGMIDMQPNNLADYGIDDFTLADFSNIDNNVNVPENEFQLDEPTDDDGNHAINHFINVVNFIHTVGP